LDIPHVTYGLGAFFDRLGFIAGWKEGVPTPYLLAACSLIFGGVSWASLQIALLRDRTKIMNNLNFSQIRVGRNIHGAGMFLGVVLVSRAGTPIELDVQEVRTSLNEKYPPRKPFAKTKFIVPANGTAWFDDHVIDIGEPPRPGAIEGFAEFKIKYGHPGALKYDLPIKKQVVVAFNAEGLFERASWNDAA
jgi:hypothetical protein